MVPRYTLYPATVDVLEAQFTSTLCCTVLPLPESPTVIEELVALLLITIEPEDVPLACGEKVTVSVALAPAASVSGTVIPVPLKPVPEKLTALIVTEVEEEFVTTTFCCAVEPITTFPNATDVGDTLNVPCGAGVGEGVGLGVGDGVGLGVGEGLGNGVGVGVGDGVGAAPPLWNSYAPMSYAAPCGRATCSLS